jgi:hypothetical protein
VYSYQVTSYINSYIIAMFDVTQITVLYTASKQPLSADPVS